MDGRSIETLLSFWYLTGRMFPVFFSFYNNLIHHVWVLFLCVHILGPLVTDPITDLDKAVIKLRQKYKTYIVE